MVMLLSEYQAFVSGYRMVRFLGPFEYWYPTSIILGRRFEFYHSDTRNFIQDSGKS